MHFVRPVLRMDQDTWIRCHQEALRFFGGCPRLWICDNLKTGVLKRTCTTPQFNRAYRELAGRQPRSRLRGSSLSSAVAPTIIER